MQTISKEGSAVILAFKNLFSKKVFEHVKTLIMGALLTIGGHTVSSALRFTGLAKQAAFHKYHRVLSLVRWSALQASKVLLHLLIGCFTAKEEALVFGIDETIERRRGKKIKAKGIYRDPVRSSHSHFVKCSGLRWISLMLLANVGWAGHVWALPFLTVLAPSERYCTEAGRRHKKVTDWARQIVVQLHRWLPKRLLVIVADSSYAVLELLNAVKDKVVFISRLRLDAALYGEVPQQQQSKRGRKRLKGERQPTLKERLNDKATRWQTITIAQWYGKPNKQVLVATDIAIWYHSGMAPLLIRWVLIKDAEDKSKPAAALLCTHTAMSAEQIIAYFVRRWTMEVTLKESRTHLGVESQRGWSDKTIERSTPVLLGLFSIVVLWADKLQKQQLLHLQQTAWYHKQHITFADAIAAVRGNLWKEAIFHTSTQNNDIINIPKSLFDQLTDLITRAA